MGVIIKKWPADGLERVLNCPICGSAKRELLYKGLTDRVFFCAPGEWTIYHCQECGSGYLDPRPTPETIGLAYSSYPTHDFKGRENLQNLSWPRRIGRILANGYYNYRFGTDYRPASFLGVLAAMIFPSKRAMLESTGRHLPKKSRGRLLDIGCGNGSFLEFAQRAGWEAVGVEPDPKAVEVAQGQGLDVHQGEVSVLNPEQEQFDVITMCHVIEHVHAPMATLRSCYQLLKPGGWIWIKTPNLNSQGHARYGANWLSLDPPRHLVLFTRSSLQKALQEAGFRRIEDQPYFPHCTGTFAWSEAIAKGQDLTQSVMLFQFNPRIIYAERKAKRDPSIREVVAVKAWKI